MPDDFSETPEPQTASDSASNKYAIAKSVKIDERSREQSDFARSNPEGKSEKSERAFAREKLEKINKIIPSADASRGREQESKKRKVSVFNIIILIILLAIIGIAIYYYLGDESELGKCSLADECGRYNVFYIQGQGYVCANDQLIGEGTIKTKLLMFKYASKKAITNEPAGCSCIESRCEVE